MRTNLALTVGLIILLGTATACWEGEDDPLVDMGTGQQLYALFWEGVTSPLPRPSDGFVVAGPDTAAFLDDALARLGLDWREANEFIVYWLPVLEASPYNFIHFATTAWQAAVPLEVTPAPDSVIRFLMSYEPLLAMPVPAPPLQILTAPPRIGFSLVEWGGARLDFH